jgi:nicotinate-nucleotide adenylyltransferase
VGVVRVGIIGGTFDPPHKGHLAISQEARVKLDLSCVIFVPAGQPWLKAEMPVSRADDRFEMVRLAIAPYPYFRVSRIEIDRQGPSYTAETLEELKAEMENETEFYFLMGWDCVSQLPRWYDPDRIISLCRLAAVPRPGYPRPDLPALERLVPGISQRVDFLSVPLVDVSATDIRTRVARGSPITDLVPEAVEKYIRERGLYRQRQT